MRFERRMTDAMAEAKRVKDRGKVVARTNRVTPTKAGKRALGKALARVRTMQKKLRGSVFTYRLEVRYRDATGKRREVVTEEVGFPLARAVRRVTKAGEGADGAWERVTVDEVMATVFRSIDGAQGIARYTVREQTIISTGTEVQVRRALRGFKARRGATVRVVVSRER